MAKVTAKRKTLKPKSKLTLMIPLHAANQHKLNNKELGGFSSPEKEFDSPRVIKSKLSKYGKFALKKIEPYLTLSAKTPNVSGKGYLNAVQCHSFLSDNPSINFHCYPMDGAGPGKLEIWLSGLKAHQKITVEIRLNGYSYNNDGVYKVSSSISHGVFGYFPVNSTSKIDLFFPDVSEVSGQGLIIITPIDMKGTWIFHDVKVNIIE